MDDPTIVDTVAAKLAELIEEQKKLEAEQAEAQREAAGRSATSWGEVRNLAELLKKDPSDENRLRLRSALRRNIEAVYCLIVRRGRDRLAVVQVWFTGGEVCRTYLLFHRLPLWGKCGCWWANSWSQARDDGFFIENETDLRDPAQAARLARALLTLSQNELDSYAADGVPLDA